MGRMERADEMGWDERPEPGPSLQPNQHRVVEPMHSILGIFQTKAASHSEHSSMDKGTLIISMEHG